MTNTDDQITQLIELYKSAQLHNDMDWEMTLGGNGIYGFHVTAVLEEVFDTLGISLDDPRFSFVAQDIIDICDAAGEHPYEMLKDYGFNPADHGVESEYSDDESEDD